MDYITIIYLLLFEASSFKLRLVQGPNYASGRLEVYHQGVWGTVCNDNFGTAEATIACKELGFLGRYWGNAQYGNGNGPIWLDDISCLGNESSLANCRHSPWGIHNCTHSQDVSVSCYDGKANAAIKFDLKNRVISFFVPHQYGE